MKNLFKILTCVLCISPLAACGGLLQSTAPQETIYTLRPVPRTDAPAIDQARVVEVMKPAVPPGFETDRIALYTNGGQKLDYYSASKWTTLIDDVIQNFTRRTMSTILPSVVTTIPAESLMADFRLQLKVNEFQAVYDAGLDTPPRLVTDLEFTLISLPEERIVRSFSLGKTGVATSNRLDVIAAGLEKMLQELQAEAFTKMRSSLYPEKTDKKQ